MNPGDLVRARWTTPFDLYDGPTFRTVYTQFPNTTGAGVVLLVLRVKEYPMYGSSVLLLTPYGTGWTHIDNLEVIR